MESQLNGGEQGALSATRAEIPIYDFRRMIKRKMLGWIETATKILLLKTFLFVVKSQARLLLGLRDDRKEFFRFRRLCVLS